MVDEDNDAVELNLVKLQFDLVCEPHYKLPPRRTPGASFTVNSASRMMDNADEIWTYDLDWSVDSRVIPDGPIRFYIAATKEALALARSSRGKRRSSAFAQMHSIDLIVICVAIRDDEPFKHELNKKWRLTVSVEIGSKLLSVEREQELPFYCSVCESELLQAAFSCTRCKHHGCLDCNSDESVPPHEDPSHVFRRVDLS